MPVFSQPDIIRFFNRGETDITNDCNLLLDRVSLDVQSTISTYPIPDYVRSITRVTFQGKKLTPLPMRDLKDAFQSGTQQGRPFWYTFNNVGQNKIRLYPVPNVAVPPVVNMWDSDIPNGVIVEFFRIADNQNFILPPWARNYLLKKYVGSQLFTIEGPGQNLKMAKYMSQQWEQWAGEFVSLISELHSAPRKLFVSDVVSGNWFPGSPLLPIDKFGISVETGY